LPADIIAMLYKSHWNIEIFFKWIKQHLRIKAFFGTSENAIKLQVWTAVSTYLLVAIMKKEFKLEQTLYTILQVLSVSTFEKMPVIEAFSRYNISKQHGDSYKQLTLFD